MIILWEEAMRKSTYAFLALSLAFSLLHAGSFNGLTSSMNDLYRLSDAKTRSISPENLNGEPGKGAMATLD